VADALVLPTVGVRYPFTAEARVADVVSVDRAVVTELSWRLASRLAALEAHIAAVVSEAGFSDVTRSTSARQTIGVVALSVLLAELALALQLFAGESAVHGRGGAAVELRVTAASGAVAGLSHAQGLPAMRTVTVAPGCAVSVVVRAGLPYLLERDALSGTRLKAALTVAARTLGKHVSPHHEHEVRRVALAPRRHGPAKHLGATLDVEAEVVRVAVDRLGVRETLRDLRGVVRGAARTNRREDPKHEVDAFRTLSPEAHGIRRLAVVETILLIFADPRAVLVAELLELRGQLARFGAAAVRVRAAGAAAVRGRAFATSATRTSGAAGTSAAPRASPRFE
jgi:hypothetical protein